MSKTRKGKNNSRKKGSGTSRSSGLGCLKVSFERVIVYLIAAFVFSLPLFIWPTVTEYGYGKTIFAIIAISILLILWAIYALVKKEWTIQLPWLVYPALGLIVASLLSLVNATNGRVVIQSLTLFVFLFLFYVIVSNFVKRKEDITLVLYALLTSAFLASLYGLLQYLGIMRGAHGGDGLGEVISTMGNRNYLGGFLAYLLFPSVILVVRLKSRLLKSICLGLMAFSFGTVLLLRQTGNVVGLIVGAVAFIAAWALFRPVEPIRRNRRWLIALLALLVITFLIEAPSGPLNSVVGLSADDNGSWISRLWERNAGRTRSWDWWVGWEMFKDHPLFGVGLGNYKLNFVPYKAQFLATPRGAKYTFYIPRAAQAHNDYVQVVAEMGILGSITLVCLLVFLPLFFWVRLRRNKNEADRLDLIFLAAGVVVFLVHALFSFPAHLPTSSLVLVLSLGIASAPVYGGEATRSIGLRGWYLKGTATAVVLLALIASFVAARDYQANILLGKGIRQLQMGQYNLAETTLNKSIRLDFCPRQTYYHLATTQINQGQYDKALESLERCRDRFVDESVYLMRANVAVNLGKAEIAQQDIDLLLSSIPSSTIAAQAQYLSAMISFRSNDHAKAIKQLEELIEEHPTFERAYISLGDVYRARGMPVTARRYLEEALSLIDKALSAARKRLSSSASMTAADYNNIRGQIETLTREKEVVEEALSDLPATGSP
jgi:O-antigen ligase/Tfp pilus assembly protein PilF